MTPETLPADKAALRRAMRADRDALAPEAVAAASAAAGAHVLALVRDSGARVVSGYLALGRELDPALALNACRDAGRTVALPRIVGRGQPLRFHAWCPGQPLETASMGVCQPLPDAPEVLPDLLLVPLLAFDASGYRLGYGGGFYDRTLAALRATRPVLAVGFAFAWQRRDAVPVEPWDEPLDMVVTEAAVHRFARRS